jgi:DNA-binding CsgD family transcriptional regulator
MSGWAMVRRVIAILLLVVWTSQVLGVAVFAVPGRFDGIESVYLSLLTLVIGLVPIVVVLYVVRDRKAGAAVPTEADARDRSVPGSTSPAGTPPSPLLEPLSERELEILALVARGYSNKEVATELVVSVATVKTHLNNSYRKLGASSRTQAIALARAHGLL